MRSPLSLDPRRAALLLIDFQEEQRVDPLYAVPGLDQILVNACKLLLAARQRGLRIYHSAYRRDFDLFPPRPFEPLTAKGTPAFSDKTNPLIAICKEVEPVDGEPVIFKNDASVFAGTSLGNDLTAAGTEWLIVAGVWSEACVAATIRDAMGAGLRVLIVKDACGSGTTAMHETAVLNLANRLYGGGVADTARAQLLIGGGEAEVWMPERPVPILFDYSDASEHYRLL